MFKLIKKYLPSSLFGRTLLILVVPTILAQVLTVYIFYERHYSNLSRHLAESLAGEVVTVTQYLESANDPESEKAFLARSKNLFFFNPKLMPLNNVKNYTQNLSKFRFKYYNTRLKNALGKPFEVYSDGSEKITTIVYFSNSALVIDVPYKRLYNSTSMIFLYWMIGSTFILTIIAIIFLRNQIRPIIRLARLADGFGRGHELPRNFKPEGAKEIRQAGSAFLNMRERISRHLKQRTEMLAGISHDLRTPLTRMKLELEIIKSKQPELDLKGFEQDIKELEVMVSSYLDFVRKDETEEVVDVNLADLIAEVAAGLRDKQDGITFNKPDSKIMAKLRPNQFARAAKNLLDNALKFGSKAEISIVPWQDAIMVIFDDNGAGIPANKREDVFKPFYRIDSSRNLDAGGTGLGLSIVRDIINSHGGTVELSDSPLGGLRAVIKLPI